VIAMAIIDRFYISIDISESYSGSAMKLL